MNKVLLFILLVSSFFGFAQNDKNIFISGVVIDENKNAVPNVNVSINNSLKGTKTDNTGHFFLTINTFKQITFSHINYYTLIKKIHEAEFNGLNNDTLSINVGLKFKVNQLESFEINGKKTESLYNKSFVPIYDYQFYGDSLLLLLKELKNTKLRLVNSKQEILAEQIVPNRCKHLFKDCFGNIHITSIDSAYQIKIDSFKISLTHSIRKGVFNSYLKPCISKINNTYIFKKEFSYNESIAYYYLNEDREVHFLNTINNEVAESLQAKKKAAKFQLQNSGNSKMSEAESSVKDARKLIQDINFSNHILTNLPESRLFSIKNNVYVFDHTNDSCWIYDKQLKFKKGVPIY
jgi:hypothetical protein